MLMPMKEWCDRWLSRNPTKIEKDAKRAWKLALKDPNQYWEWEDGVQVIAVKGLTNIENIDEVGVQARYNTGSMIADKDAVHATFKEGFGAAIGFFGQTGQLAIASSAGKHESDDDSSGDDEAAPDDGLDSSDDAVATPSTSMNRGYGGLCSFCSCYGLVSLVLQRSGRPSLLLAYMC